jgi:sirohydrochlorin cobaltochelatase
MATQEHRRAPMGSAPIRYGDDGAVAWGAMWDTFCELAQAGGPPHRATTLLADQTSDPSSPAYQAVVAEIVRGVELVSALTAAPGPAGWVAVRCHEASMARWLCDAINQENVQARCDGAVLLVPAGERYQLNGEIKSVITAVAKTTHYWGEHLPGEVRSALWLQEGLGRLQRRIISLWKRSWLSEAVRSAEVSNSK